MSILSISHLEYLGRILFEDPPPHNMLELAVQLFLWSNYSVETPSMAAGVALLHIFVDS